MSDLAPTRAHSSLRLDTVLGPDRLLLEAIEGEEHLSAPFRYTLAMSAAADDVDAAELVNTAACVTLAGDDGDERRVHGLVTHASQAGRHCVAELRPRLWELTLSSDCRIFQGKTVPEVVKSVLHEHAVADVEDQLTGSYPSLDYCVQYRESAFDFVSRLLEDAGIAYFFKHSAEAHTLVLTDDVSGHPTCGDAAPVPFEPLPGSRAWLGGRRVEAASFEQGLASTGVLLDDYAFATAATELKAEVGGTRLRLYDYPGGYATKSEGDTIAARRLSEAEAETRRLRGEATVRAFVAGGRFALAEHPRAALNQGWLLRSLRLQAELGTFRNGFVAVPETTPFRPPRRTAKPRIAGSQTALVVGAAGEELWTDAHGRIKVQFHWDQRGTKDENSSCWLRVAQAWSGSGWGGFVLPRVGQEVVVSFLEGDPDRPLVTGCVYNGTNAPPYALPDARTRTTLKSSSSPGGDGFNELRFEDKAGEEEVYLHAQKDLTVEVGNARTVTVSEADDTLTVSKGNRSVTVETGNETLTVAGTREVKVIGAETHTSEADFNHTVGGSLTVEVTGNVTIKASGSLSLEAGTSVSIKAGTALTLEGGTTMTLKGAASGTVDGGGMLTVKGGLVKIN